MLYNVKLVFVMFITYKAFPMTLDLFLQVSS